MSETTPVIKTERLIMRPTDMEDSSFIYALLNTPNWIKYIGDKNVNSIEDAVYYIKTRILPPFKRFGYSTYTVIRKSDKVKIGTCGLYNRKGIEGVDIGFAFLSQFEGKGYAYESVLKLKEIAFNDFKLKKISAITIKENIKSQRLLIKIGLDYNKTIKLPNDKTELLLYHSKEH